MTVRDRALVLVVTALAVFVGVAFLLVLQLNRVQHQQQEIQHQQDRDMCAMLDAVIPTVTPSPGGYGAAQVEGINDYRASRCR